MRKIGKNGKGNGMTYGFVFLAVIILGVGYFAFSQNVSSNPNLMTSCDSTTSPTLTIKAFDKETGTALTEATNLYRVKGEKTWSTFTAGTGFEANANDVLEVVMGISTTDFTDNAYGEMFEVVVPCKESPSVEYEMANDEVETSLVATFYNADSDASAETFVADETQTVSIKVKAGNNEYFGNPYLSGNQNILVLTLNSSEWDMPEQVYLADGTELESATLPGRHTTTSGFKDYAYEMPVIGDKQVEIKMDLNSDASTAPTVDGTASMYAAGYFYNSDNQAIEFGVENQEDVAVGTDAADTVVLDMTA